MVLSPQDQAKLLAAAEQENLGAVAWLVLVMVTILVRREVK
jgi:hypothetical protein